LRLSRLPIHIVFVFYLDFYVCPCSVVNYRPRVEFGSLSANNIGWKFLVFDDFDGRNRISVRGFQNGVEQRDKLRLVAFFPKGFDENVKMPPNGIAP
jgi:hypothetical protein